MNLIEQNGKISFQDFVFSLSFGNYSQLNHEIK